MRVLVTGGAGFIGSHLTDGLVAEGHEVRVLDALLPQVHGEGASWPAYLARECERVRGDLRDRAVVEKALQGVEVVFHEAAAVGIGQSMYEIADYVAKNSLGAAVLLEAVAASRRVERMVVASSMSIYGEGLYRDARGRTCAPGMRSEAQLEDRAWELRGPDGSPLEPLPTPEDKPLLPTSVYAVTKRDHEELFLAVGRAYRIPTVALRYFNVYGSRQALSNPYTGVAAIFCSRLLNGRAPVIFEDGLQTRDFVHVSDVVRANLLALRCAADEGVVYNVGTGRPTAIRRVAELLAERLGLEIEPEIRGRYRAGDIRHCVADVTRAKDELGFEAERVFERDGIDEVIGFAREQRPEDRADAATRELERRGLAR